LGRSTVGWSSKNFSRRAAGGEFLDREVDLAFSQIGGKRFAVFTFGLRQLLEAFAFLFRAGIHSLRKSCDMSHHRRRPAKSWKRVCCHSFRATGVTEYMNSGGTIEIAQRIAGYTSPATTRIYDRSGDRLTLKRSRECRSGRDKRIEFRAYVPVWIDAESVPGRGVDPTIDVCAINRSTGFSISLQRLRGIVVNACPIVV
jgi:hypothetical protein